MKQKIQPFLVWPLSLFLVLAIAFTGCKQDEPAPKQKADFDASSSTIAENAGTPSTITINFSDALAEAGSLDVTIENGTGVAYTTNYITSPNGSSGSFTLDVSKGAASTSFTITPVDDSDVNDNRTVTFKINSATGGIELGTSTSHVVTITNDDSPVNPAVVDFELAASSVAENAGIAHTVNLTFDTAVPEAGSFDVTITSTDATYTTDYTTDPAALTDVITIAVAKDATTASFTVTPVDNADVAADKTIVFTLSAASGGVSMGTTIPAHTLTITEDDISATIKTIAEIRAMYDGVNPVDIVDNFAITGIVTSNKGAVTSKNLFIQDATAGIVIRWSDNNIYNQGDELTVSLMGATISDYNDLVQIGGTMPLTNGTVVSSANSVTPVTITFADLNTDAYQAQLVTVDNVTFAGADGLQTVSGNNTGNDGTADGVVRVESYATFKDDLLPIGTGSITGLAGIYSGTAQVLPQEASGFFANSPTGTITIAGTINDFGSVLTNSVSSSQSFTVEGTTLTNDISIAAPSEFEVSLDDATFTADVLIPFATANAGPVTVYVRFAPTTGFQNTHTGDVIAISSGAVSQTVAVSGTETPPGGGTTVLLAEDFDYGSTPGNLTTITTNWVKSSGTAPLAYLASSLSMTGYGSTGVGGSVGIADPDASAEDASRTFNGQSSGSVYMGALVNIASFNSTGDDYFLHFRNASGAYFGRIYAKDDGAGNLKFGIRENSTSGTVAQYSTGNYAYNTTYLIVMKYDFATGTSSIYILDNAAASEPASADASSSDGVDPSDLAQIGIRQGTNTPVGTIDGIRVATDWAGVIGN